MSRHAHRGRRAMLRHIPVRRPCSACSACRGTKWRTWLGMAAPYIFIGTTYRLTLRSDVASPANRHGSRQRRCQGASGIGARQITPVQRQRHYGDDAITGNAPSNGVIHMAAFQESRCFETTEGHSRICNSRLSGLIIIGTKVVRGQFSGAKNKTEPRETI